MIARSREEPEAFAILVRRHGPPVQRYVTRRIGAGAAEDVAAETFLLAFRFRFPFTGGITEILFNASTYQLAGYVRGGTEIVITKEALVSGPGSLKPSRPYAGVARSGQS